MPGDGSVKKGRMMVCHSLTSCWDCQSPFGQSEAVKRPKRV